MTSPFLKVVPPRTRTIRYASNVLEECVFIRFSLPELTFLIDKHRFANLSVRVGDCYCPFRFFNVRNDGSICLPPGDFTNWHGAISPEGIFRRSIMDDIVDFFWTTSFNDSAFPCNFESKFLPVNDEIGWISLLEWQSMTEQDPDFMGRKFDPHYFSLKHNPPVKHFFRDGVLEPRWR